MAEDAKALGDGPAFDPTNRLRGLAAVGEFAGTAAMRGTGEGVSSRGNSYVLVDWLEDVSQELVDHMITLSTNTED